MTNILHLSESFLSGYPARLSRFLNENGPKYRSRCITMKSEHPNARLDVDMVMGQLSEEAFFDRVQWADIVHLHGTHSIPLLSTIDHAIRGKRIVIQVYEHPEEGAANPSLVPPGIPYIITPVCSWPRWPTATFMAPEVPHFYENINLPDKERPLVSFDIKHMPELRSYRDIIFPLKSMQKEKQILYYPIENRLHDYAVTLKQAADIAVGDIVFGRYNLSALDYASAGVPCFCRVKGYTRENIEKLTGAINSLPWIHTDKDHFLLGIKRVVDRKLWKEQGQKTKGWMEKYWNKDMILRHYDDVYLSL